MTLSKNKIIIKYGEEKLVLKGLTDADALYDVIEKAVFPDDMPAAEQTDIPEEVSDDMTDEEVFADLADDVAEELFDVENTEEIEAEDFAETEESDKDEKSEEADVATEENRNGETNENDDENNKDKLKDETNE